MCNKDNECCCNNNGNADGSCGCGNASNSGTLTAAMEVAGVESIPGANVQPPTVGVTYGE